MRFAGISKKLFQEWLSDTILGGFLISKSPKKGSKTPKNHIQDNRIANSFFNKNDGWPQADQDLRSPGQVVVN